MQPTDFTAPEAGHVVTTGEGYAAFVPAPLPPRLAYDDETILALSRADAALSELSGIGRQLPNPSLLIAPYVRLEAVLSSRIEGTQASLTDLLLEELHAPGVEGDASDVQEVRNYVAAMEHGLKRLRAQPLGLALVKELHQRLMKGVRGGSAEPGKFRRSQNWIGVRGSTPATAVYVPPPPDELPGCLDAWEDFLHRRGSMPDLVQCALLHEQFEAIHPFLDGNGRVGRLLITLFLVERERLSQPLLYLSDFIEAHRREYYQWLQAVRTRGDWIGWLQFFLHGVSWTARKAIRQATQLLDLRESLRVKLRDAPRAVTLVDGLFVNPYMTVARAADVLGVTLPTARKGVGALVAAGVVREMTGRSWGRVYVCTSVLEAIEHPEGEAER